MDLRSCVLHVASTVLTEVSGKEYVPLRDLNARLVEKHGKAAEQTVLGALGFLYIVGKLEYYEDLDAVALVGGDR